MRPEEELRWRLAAESFVRNAAAGMRALPGSGVRCGISSCGFSESCPIVVIPADAASMAGNNREKTKNQLPIRAWLAVAHSQTASSHGFRGYTGVLVRRSS